MRHQETYLKTQLSIQMTNNMHRNLRFLYKSGKFSIHDHAAIP